MDWVEPDYDGGSIVNLSASLLQSFGVEPPSPACKHIEPQWLSGGRGTVLLLCDALGRLQLDEALQSRHLPNLARLVEEAAGGLQQLTSIFPSTTTAALTSINTARPPAEHGLMGMYQWIDEVGSVCNMLQFATLAEKPVFFSEELLRSGPNIHQLLASRDISSYVISSADFEGTAFTGLLHQGAHYSGCIAQSDISHLLAQSFTQAGDKRSLHYVYWPMVDTIAHHYGPLTEPYLLELEFVDFMLGKVMAQCAAAGYNLVFTADHGQTYMEPQQAVRVDEDLHGLLRHLPGGGRRALYLSTDDKNAVQQCNALQVEGIEIIDTEDAIARGWFGGDCGPYRSRVGDLIVLATAERQLLYDYGKGLTLWRGGHASLTAAEMLVPLLVRPCD